MTNAEKQERYRKKEALKKLAREASIRIQLAGMNYFIQGRNKTEIQKRLEDVSNLPSRWTDDDYQHAVQCIQNIIRDTLHNPHLLKNDLNENFYSIHGLTADFKLIRDLRNAESISLKLTDTILSSIALSGLSVADAAATVINVLRSLGRSLADLREIPQSNATALTIAINGPLFPKPDWFYGRFSKMLCEQLGEKEANALGSVLSNFKVFEEQNNE